MTLKELLGEAYKDGMTMDDLTAALATISLNADQSELLRAKNAVSKANSEAAQYKRNIRDLQSESERQVSDWASKYEALEKRFNEAERDRNISKHTASLIGMGYESALALDTATAMVDGDLAKLLVNQQAFLVAHDKKALEDKMGQTPRPEAGGGSGIAVDWNKRIKDAIDSGDMALAASLTRQQYESNNQTT